MRDKLIRDSLLRCLGMVGMHAVKRTAYTYLIGLIHSLRPVDSGTALIRLGPAGDGGYLVPDDLEGIQYGFSPGVSTESGFEADLATRDIQVHLADLSVDHPAEANTRFTFEKKHLGSFTSDTLMTMDEWARKHLADYHGDLILQMDIEGAEFETLMNTSPELLARFRIMVIEFHYLHQLWNKPWFVHVARVFEKLLHSHSVVHIHPNNCCGSISSKGLEIPRILEMTFYRNDRLKQRSYCQTFPHPLDHDNTKKRPLILPECWYR